VYGMVGRVTTLRMWINCLALEPQRSLVQSTMNGQSGSVHISTLCDN